MIADDVLRDALFALRSRAVTYDSPGGERSMPLTVDLFNRLTDHRLTEAEGWLFMICLKLSRSAGGRPHADDYVDLAGYAALLGECVTRGDPNDADGG